MTDAYYVAADPAGNPNSWQREDHFNYDALGTRRGWDYVASRAQWMNFTRKDNGLNQYRAWWPYSWINYDDDIGNGWGSPGQANGVVMQDGWVTAGYNALNQPMYIWSGGVGWTYFGYDPLGRCVKRWADNGSVAYLYYDGWNLIQEGSQSSYAERQYIHGARVDEIVAQITPPNNWIRYFHYDANGNCTLQTDGGGNIAEQYDYDAFGFPYFYDAWGNNIGYSPWGNRVLFTGREWLKDLKLYDYRNRLYQPELGRFMQPDPKEFAAGDYNLYRYCHNDPVNRTDPMGEEGWTDYPRVVWALHFNLAKIDQVLDIKHAAEKAGQEAEQGAKANGTFAETPDIANAVRHLELSARLTSAFGVKKAKEITDIHEDGAKDKDDSAVDQKHNALGREIGGTLHRAPAEVIHQKVVDALKTEKVILKIHEKNK
jgi:RHS repeat-associated protein